MTILDGEARRRLTALAYELDDILAEAEPTPVLPVEKGPKLGHRLAVIVGHSEARPGAAGLPPVGEREYAWNRGLAGFMESAARHHEALALRVFNRDRGGLRGAYGRARDWRTDAAIELHFNAAASAEASGTETIYGDRERDGGFAAAIQAAMVGVLGLRDRGCKQPWTGRGAVNLSLLDVPSVIVEPGFGSNRRDCRVMHDRRAALAAALVAAADGYLKSL